MFDLDQNRFSGTKVEIDFGVFECKLLKIDLNYILNMVLIGSSNSDLEKFIQKIESLNSISGLNTDITLVDKYPLEFFDRLKQNSEDRMQKAKDYSNSSPATRFLHLTHEIFIYKNFDNFITAQGMQIKTIELGIIRKVLTFTRMIQVHQFFCFEDIDNLNTTVLSALAPYTFDFYVIFDNENLQKFISSKRFYKNPKKIDILGSDEAVIVSQGELLKINLKIGS